MKALRFTQYGPPEVLGFEEVPKPEPQSDEVLVQVRATAVNDWDWSFLRGKPHIYRLLFGLSRPKVNILGAELAGVVEKVGKDVTQFKPGDAVYGDISEAGFGGFAEYACVNKSALFPMPHSVSFEQAAALPHAALLALQGLVDAGGIKAGQDVLINGAGGGVGTLGVQIAKHYGAKVTGIDAAAKLEPMRALGFDSVIDFQREDFTKSGHRYDVILDAKTTRSPFSYLRALKAGGRYVSVGGHVSKLLQLVAFAPLVSAFSGKQLRLLALKPNKDLALINRLVEERKLVPLIDGPYPLSNGVQALARFGEAKHLGKVVLTVSA